MPISLLLALALFCAQTGSPQETTPPDPSIGVDPDVPADEDEDQTVLPQEIEEDENAELVIVLSRETNENMFGGENSVGQQVLIDGRSFTITGVLDHWAPTPIFYDVNNGAFDDPEDVYIPFSLTEPLKLDSAGNTNCWKDEPVESFDQFMASECIWIQYWVQLDDALGLEARTELHISPCQRLEGAADLVLLCFGEGNDADRVIADAGTALRPGLIREPARRECAAQGYDHFPIPYA